MIGDALVSAGASLISGLLNPVRKNVNTSAHKSNVKNIARANLQNKNWNKAVQKKADKAAKIPIISDTKSRTSGGGSLVTTKTSGGGQKTTSTTTGGGSRVVTKQKGGGSTTINRGGVNLSQMMKDAERSGLNIASYVNAMGGYYGRSSSRTDVDDMTTSTRTQMGKQTTKTKTSIADQKTSVKTKQYAQKTHTINTLKNSQKMDAALVGLSKPAYNYYEAGVSTGAGPGMTTGQAIGNALNAGVNTYMAQNQTNQQNAFQERMLDKTLAAGQTRGSQPNQSFVTTPSTGGVQSNAVYQTPTQRSSGYGGGASGGGGGGGSVGGGYSSPLTLPQLTGGAGTFMVPKTQGASDAGNPYGTELNVNPGLSIYLPGPDAQAIEDVLGEDTWATEIYGVGRLAAAAVHPTNIVRGVVAQANYLGGVSTRFQQGYADVAKSWNDLLVKQPSTPVIRSSPDPYDYGQRRSLD